MGIKLRNVILSSILGISTGLIGTSLEALTLSGNSKIKASDFRITTFATGLNYPTGAIRLNDGSLLVGTSTTTGTGNFFNNSVGEIVRLVDSNSDGVSDSRSTIFSGLPGGISGISQAGNLIFATSFESGSQRISVLQQRANTQDQLDIIGSLNFKFPENPLHVSTASTVKDLGAGKYELFFNVGSQFNSVASTTPVGSTSSEFGLDTSLEADSIYRISIDNSSNNPVFTNLEKIAAGLRNAAGLALQSGSGDLYFVDNGIDGLSDATIPESPDELNLLNAANIGGTVEDYGFSNNYIQYRTGTEIGSGSVPSLALFQPIPDPIDPNTESRSEGANGLAFAPPAFPNGLNNGIFVGFFGSFAPPNQENPVLYYDLATGKYFPFIDSNQTGVGYPIGLLSTNDSLFVSDFASDSNLFVGQGDGVIYQIQAVPVPFDFEVPIIAWLGLGVGYWIFRKRK